MNEPQEKTFPKGDCHGADHCHCCPDSAWHQELALSRRNFLATAAVGGAVLTGLSWTRLARADGQLPMPPKRTTLKVLPILVWNHPRRAEQRSWRNWGGIERPEQAAEEVKRIQRELQKITADADFPVQFMDVQSVNDVKQADAAGVEAADVVIVYGAGTGVNGCEDFGKDVIIFQRHRSGPVYLQYEIISPRFLRQHTDKLARENIQFDDVVTDRLDELTWRLRALCGLKNTKSSKNWSGSCI